MITPKFYEYPFRILHIFFLEVYVERVSEIVGEVPLQLKAEVSFSMPEEDQPYELKLRFRTSDGDDSPVKIRVVIVAHFETVEENHPDTKILNEFMNRYLLAAMVSRFRQVIGTTTSQMGMPPLWPPFPKGFGFDINEE